MRREAGEVLYAIKIVIQQSTSLILAGENQTMIKEINWDNHAILGNLSLDFSKGDGSAYNTIILAGENGTGKTKILDTLSTFLNLGSFEPFN